MKAILLSCLLSPLGVWAQHLTISPDSSQVSLIADTLKPIEFREIPYTYNTSSTSTYRGRTTTTYSTHSGIHRIYSYDGIDVDDPEQNLWPYMLALKDPNVKQQYREFQTIVSRKQTAIAVGTIAFISGLVMSIVGAAQAKEYRAALEQQKQSYTVGQVIPPTPTPTTTTNVLTIANCGIWIGTGSTWTCYEPGANYGKSVNYDPFTYIPPVTTPTPTPIRPTPVPTTVDKPNGTGLVVGGVLAMLAGGIISASTPGNQHSTFLKAVQYYNRALKRTISWEIRPYSTYGQSGISLVGHF